MLIWYQSHPSDFLVPVDISGVLPLPSPSSSSHCQKRVTAVTPTVPATLGSHCSAHPTVKAKALSDRTDNPEKNPTKNSQKPIHTRLHAPLEVSASRARAPRTTTHRHTPSLSLMRPTRLTRRNPRTTCAHTRQLRFTDCHISPSVTSHSHGSTRHMLT